MTISVIIPTLGNRPEMLAKAIASVKAQTVPAHEIIVVDYEDNTEGNQARRINYGVRKSTGTHYVFMGDDDMLMPNFIQKMTELADGYDIVSTGFQNFGEDEGVNYPGRVPLCSTIVSREMYDKTEGYEEGAGVACDAAFYYQCFELGAKWNNNQGIYLYKSRVHPGQYSKVANWDAAKTYINTKYAR